MSDLNLRMATEIIRYYARINAPLVPFQQSTMQSAVKEAMLQVYHLKSNERCERCYSKVSVGRVVTVSPNANFSNMFPVCMKNILELEAWLRGQTPGKSPKDGALGEQGTL